MSDLPTSQASGQDAELWKERLGFASGTIVVWGVVLLQLLPHASALQLPNGHDLVAENGLANADSVAFSLLNCLSGLGGTVVFLATIHMLSRGFWLARQIRHSGGNDGSTLLNRVCEGSFVSVFSVTKAAIWFLLCIPLTAVLIPLQHAIHSQLEIESKVGGWFVWVSLLIPVGLALALFVHIARCFHLGRLFSKWLSDQQQMLFSLPGGVAFVVFVAFVVLVSHTRSTIELGVNRTTIYRSQDQVVEASVKVGGVTSQPDK